MYLYLYLFVKDKDSLLSNFSLVNVWVGRPSGVEKQGKKRQKLLEQARHLAWKGKEETAAAKKESALSSLKRTNALRDGPKSFLAARSSVYVCVDV